MNHTTKWNRVNVNEVLVKDFTDAKETMYLNKIKPSREPMGIGYTVNPDGIVINKKMMNV